MPIDPEIRSLAEELRARAAQSRAASTFESYAAPWARFKSWCLSKNVSPLPASPMTVALSLTLVLRTASSPNPVLTCSGAIYLHHQLAGLPSPTSHPLVAISREIARRQRVAGQNKKKPLLASHVCQLFELWLYRPGATLHDMMRLAAIVLCYVGFLRFSDLTTVQWQEILFFPTHMELFLEKTKTDQYREGRWVLISRVGGRFCPFAPIERLLRSNATHSWGQGP